MTDAAAGSGTGAAGAQPGAGAAGAAGAGGQAGAGAQPGAGANGAGGNGAGGTPWYAPLGAEPKTAQLFDAKGFKNINEVSKAYHDLEAVIGAKGVIVPKDDAPPEEWAKYHKAVGAYDDPAKVEIALHDPKYQPTDAEKGMHEALRKAAVEAGLTPRQWKALNGAYNGIVGKTLDGIKQAAAAEDTAGETAIAELEAGWRKNGVDPVKAKALAQRAAQTIIPKDSPLYGQIEKALALDGKPGSGSAAMVDLFHRIGTMMGESGGVLKAGGANGSAQTPTQAQADINAYNAEISANPKHPYHNPHDPGHRAAHEKMMRLMTIAYPGNIGEGAANV